MKRLLFAVLTCCSITLHAGESPNATTVSATDLKTQPDAKSAAIMSLPVQSGLVVGERQGAWYKATFANKTGWVKLLSVKLLGEKTVTQRSGLSDLAAASKGTKSNVGTGIRGLTTEQLQKAEENMDELAKLERNAVTPEEAQAFARSVNIVATKSTADKE